MKRLLALLFISACVWGCSNSDTSAVDDPAGATPQKDQASAGGPNDATDKQQGLTSGNAVDPMANPKRPR